MQKQTHRILFIFVTALLSLQACAADRSDAPEMQVSPSQDIVKMLRKLNKLKVTKNELKAMHMSEIWTWRNDGPCSCLKEEFVPKCFGGAACACCAASVIYPTAEYLASYCDDSASPHLPLIAAACISAISGLYLWEKQNESLKRLKSAPTAKERAKVKHKRYRIKCEIKKHIKEE